jgi:hypothetical protein
MNHDIFILIVQGERANPVLTYHCSGPRKGEKYACFEELNSISKALDASHEAFKSFMVPVVQITYFWQKKI